MKGAAEHPDALPVAPLEAPAGFRLRTWEYPPGTHRTGMVCNACGYCADPKEPERVTQADLDRAAVSHQCPEPRYAWDLWHRQARAAGVTPELAELGRSAYREALQHGWPFRVDGDAMIRRALASPAETAAWWSRLLDEEL